MINTIEAQNSGYRFMPGVSQYSCGVAALPGFALERVRFADPVPLRAGFARIAEILKSAGRPLTAFAACELRSPAPFTEEGFKAFNEIYIKTLIEWGVMKDGVNQGLDVDLVERLEAFLGEGRRRAQFASCKGGERPPCRFSGFPRSVQSRPGAAPGRRSPTRLRAKPGSAATPQEYWLTPGMKR